MGRIRVGINQVVAMWGSPGSGVTATSVKIALELAARKNNVILVLCDDVVPSVPLIAPAVSERKSLGNLLIQPKFSQISILEHCIPVTETLSLLGYQLGENEMTYGEYSPPRARKLISRLRDFADADYVIIDCFHQMLVNVMTAAALESADIVLRVINADPKSLICLKSQKPYLAEERFHYDRHISIINNLLPSQDSHPYKDYLGGKAFLLPHLDALKAQYDEARLLEPLKGREARSYNSVIQNIVKEVILNE